jgi:ParB/RepB/Spo0J family partition protein
MAKAKTGKPAEAVSAKQSAGKPAAADVFDGEPIWGPEEEISLHAIERHPANRSPSDASIEARAESMRRLGQLEPIRVVPLPGGDGYRLISGATRWMAAFRLGWSAIRAQVLQGQRSPHGTIQPTDSYVLGLLAEDNSQREDLTPSQRAKLGMQLVGAGFTMAEAARRVGWNSHSTLSNWKRILDLPAEIVSRIDLPDDDEAKIPQEFARRFADYADVPKLLDAFVSDFAAHREDWDDLESSVAFVRNDVTRGLTPEDVYPSEPIARAPAFRLECLDEISQQNLEPVMIDGKQRTLNVELWNQLQAEIKSDKSPAESEDSEESDRTEKAFTDHESRERAAQKLEQLKKRRERWFHAWQRAFVARKLQAGDPQVLDVVGWAIRGWVTGLGQLMVSAVAETAGSQLRNPAIDADGMVAMVADYQLRNGFWPETYHAAAVALLSQDDPPGKFAVSRSEVQRLAESYGWDTEEQWIRLQGLHDTDPERERLRAFFDLHDLDQLVDLTKQWGTFVNGDAKKAPLVMRLVSQVIKLSCPQCLCPAKKGGGTTKAKAKKAGKGKVTS